MNAKNIHLLSYVGISFLYLNLPAMSRQIQKNAGVWFILQGLDSSVGSLIYLVGA